MAKIKGKDTKPEWIVRRYLFSRGYRYRKNVKGLPGTPDIVLRKYGIVILFTDVLARAWGGRYHAQDQPRVLENKIEGNKLRDKRNKEKLRKMGWSVITVWECQLKSAVRQQTLLEIEYYINHTYLERFSRDLPCFMKYRRTKIPPAWWPRAKRNMGRGDLYWIDGVTVLF